MAKLPNDYELDFLKTCTKEELEQHYYKQDKEVKSILGEFF